MSSTNRSKRAGMGADYFVTPVEAIQTFLHAFKKDYALLDPSWWAGTDQLLQILDPCAGGDEVNPCSYPEALSFTPLSTNDHIRTIDIRADSRAQVTGDYLHEVPVDQPDVIISNPPFVLAQQFIKKGLLDVRVGGLVIMLLRLNYFGTQDRLEFWRGCMPILTYVHAKRMSFWPKEISPAMRAWCEANQVKIQRPGATDSIEYCHCVWQKGVLPSHTRLTVI